MIDLAVVFEKAETPDVLREWISETLEIVSVGDLLGYVEKGHYEREWRDLIVGAFPVVLPQVAVNAILAAEGQEAQPMRPATQGFSDGKQRLLISRMRTTYKMALGVEQADEEDVKAAKMDVLQADPERPLDPETHRRLIESWKELQGWQPVQSMKAAPKLRNRIVREFVGRCVTTHAVERCISTLMAKRPVEPERTPVGPPSASASLVYEHERPQTRGANTLLEYFACLRLLLGAYAYCGSHEVESTSHPGTKVIFFPWETAIAYVDDAMHKTLEIAIPEFQKLRWIRVRDEKTRATMASLINEGAPGGEAIQMAVVKHAHLWDMEDKTTAAETLSTRESGQDTAMEDGQSSQPRGSKRAVSAESKGNRLAFSDAKKRKICGTYNGKKGCPEPCSKGLRHTCSILASDNRACECRFGKPNHNAMNCPQRR